METVIRGAAIYVVLLIIVRLSGRRTLAQMTAFDLVLVLICAETTQQALLSDDFSLTNAVILVITLFTLDIILSFVKGRWPLAEKIMDGVPTILVTNGHPDQMAMKRCRVDMADVMQAAREKQGLEHLAQVKYAVLEAGGDITIIPMEPKA